MAFPDRSSGRGRAFNKSNAFCKEVDTTRRWLLEAEAETELLIKITLSAKKSIISGFSMHSFYQK
jgi:hypothetical protein